MSTEANKTIVRRYFEDAWDQKNLAAVDEIAAATVTGHAPDATIRGAEALKQRIIEGLSEVPGMRFTIVDVIGEGDKVCVRWNYRGMVEGKPVAFTGMHLFYLAAGKIEEFWVNLNKQE